jgi:hypothetical protein
MKVAYSLSLARPRNGRVFAHTLPPFPRTEVVRKAAEQGSHIRLGQVPWDAAAAARHWAHQERLQEMRQAVLDPLCRGARVHGSAQPSRAPSPPLASPPPIPNPAPRPPPRTSIRDIKNLGMTHHLLGKWALVILHKGSLRASQLGLISQKQLLEGRG